LGKAAAGGGAKHTDLHALGPTGDGSNAAAQAWAGRYIVTSMLTGVVSTFGACQIFFVMVSSLLGGVGRHRYRHT
jgi:hypothetical protein